VTASPDELKALERSCVEDGLLATAFGGSLRITKKGREVVKVAATVDHEVADALRDALRTPWLSKREALVTVLLLTRLRRPSQTIPE
jgi:hypothetical protein